ncbi:unnamed protein product [Leptosia nina]|uniref:MADF domain-containing protein n=1 Tax=Leptosia nina TaxID=320188 RepID=A0AAV1JYL8_9NEOP
MSAIDIELLIRLVEKKPVLWDKTQVYYKNRQPCFTAWREICLELNKNFETLSEREKNNFGRDIIKRWNNARDSWMKYHKKIKGYSPGAKKQRKYKFYDQMLFLRKIFVRRKTEEIKSQKTRKINLNKKKEQSDTEESDSQIGNELSTLENTNDENERIMRVTDCNESDRLPTVTSVEDMSKSMCFFRSIAPIVEKYNDDDYIEFQYEVVKVMKNLSRRNQEEFIDQASFENTVDENRTTDPIPFTPSICPQKVEPQELLQEDEEGLN